MSPESSQPSSQHYESSTSEEPLAVDDTPNEARFEAPTPAVAKIAPHAGEVACQAQLAAEAQRQRGPRLARWSSVVRFADEHSKSGSGDVAEKLFTGLHPERLSKRAGTLGPLVAKLWREPRNRLVKEPAIDLDVALAVMREVIQDAEAYNREALRRTFEGINSGDLSMFAEFLNATLNLPEEQQIPLRGPQQSRSHRKR